MSDTTIDELTSFQQWVLKSFAELGTAPSGAVDPLGMTFESEGRQARILPHSDAALALVEVEVEVADLADKDEGMLSRLALVLLRLNDEARFEHSWQAVLDADDILCIYAQISMASTSAEGLADLLDDGIARAAMLADGLQGLSGLGMQDPAAAIETITTGMVRG
jgi:hypothetical protein